MQNRILAAAVAVSAVAHAGCDSPPTAPTTARAVTFEDAFWQALVFDGHEKPGGVTSATSRVLATTSPNFYIRLGDAAGRQRVVPQDALEYMRGAIPDRVRELTGERFRGRIEHGMADRRRRGWITVVFADEAERPGLPCGQARVGADEGRIWLKRDDACTTGRYSFPSAFTHELGHAMGFWHVPQGKDSAMYTGYTGRETFSERDQLHTQLAYETGRGSRYCGDPRTCAPSIPGLRPGPHRMPVVVLP